MSGREDAGGDAADPLAADALQERALAAFHAGHRQEALGLMRAAVAAAPAAALRWRNLCTMAEREGDYTLALGAAERSVLLAPEDATAWQALAVVRYRLAQPDGAAAAARMALRCDPGHAGAHVILAETLLLAGDYEAGWAEWVWRERLLERPPAAPQPGCASWNGAQLPGGRLLLVADQGYGDAIQFARYLGWAAARCRAVALVAAPELAPLFAPLLAPGAVLAGWEAVAATDLLFDAWAPLSDLPRLAGTRAQAIPAPASYLAADPAAVAAWSARLEALAPRPARRVGLVWAGRATHPNDASRSAPAAALAPLAAVAGVTLLALQPGADAAAAAAIAPGLPVLAGAIGDFAGLAAATAALDLLVTVDSAPAHLAGALGRPVWVMLAYGPDWRWGLDRADCPWYPSALLFRPTAPRDWAGLAATVAAALGEWAAGRLPPFRPGP